MTWLLVMALGIAVGFVLGHATAAAIPTQQLRDVPAAFLPRESD